METKQRKRETWTVHMDRALFNKIKRIAEAEGRTIRGQLERTIHEGLRAQDTKGAQRGS